MLCAVAGLISIYPYKLETLKGCTVVQNQGKNQNRKPPKRKFLWGKNLIATFICLCVSILDNFKMYACVITVLLFCNITEQKHKWSETCCQHFYLESNRFFIRNWNITFVNATSIIFNWPQLSARVAIPAEVKLPHCASTIDCSCLQCFPIAYSTRKKVLVD